MRVDPCARNAYRPRACSARGFERAASSCLRRAALILRQRRSRLQPTPAAAGRATTGATGPGAAASWLASTLAFAGAFALGLDKELLLAGKLLGDSLDGLYRRPCRPCRPHHRVAPTRRARKATDGSCHWMPGTVHESQLDGDLSELGLQWYLRSSTARVALRLHPVEFRLAFVLLVLDLPLGS
jgi:hypothetical protein